MGGEHDVVELEQRRAGGRLAHEHVEACAGDAVRLEGRVERVLVDESTAGDVDDEGRRLHERELVGADHARGLGRLRHVDRDEVAGLQKLVEAQQRDAELLGACAGDVGVVGDHGHPEGLQALRDESADAAEADDADSLLVELDAGVLGALPETLGETRVCDRDVPGEAQDVPDRELGRGDDVGGGRVHDHHAGGGCGLDVDVVEADAGAGDHLEVRRRGDRLGVDVGRGTDEDRVGVSERGQQRWAVGAVDGAYVEVGPEGVDGSGREFFGDQHDRLGHGEKSFVVERSVRIAQPGQLYRLRQPRRVSVTRVRP